jgi:metal-dependent amidase/aminoacylase/carboxypeptidase family protein
MHEGIERTAKAEAAMSGAPAPEVKLVKGSDAVVNDAALVGRTVKLFKAALGDRNVIPISPITASEDFSDFINQGVPSMFYTLGVYDPRRWPRPVSPAASRCPSITHPSSPRARTHVQDRRGNHDPGRHERDAVSKPAPPSGLRVTASAADCRCAPASR